MFLSVVMSLGHKMIIALGDISPQLLKVVNDGGLAVIVFIIWFFTFKFFTKQHQKLFKEMLMQHKLEIEKYEKLVKEVTADYKNVVKQTTEDHNKVIDKFIGFVEKGMEQQNYITGLLIRFETQLKQILKYIEKTTKV